MYNFLLSTERLNCKSEGAILANGDCLAGLREDFFSGRAMQHAGS